MNSTKNIWVALIAVGIIAIGAFFLGIGHAPVAQSLGATSNQCNGGNCTSYTAVQTTVGYWANQYKVIDSTGNWVGNIASTTGSAIVGTFTQGGGITASSTSASVTLAGTEFTTSNRLDYTVNLGSVSLTLNASTTPPCSAMTAAGQVRTVYIRHATTTAASNLTIIGGTGVALKRTATSSPATIFGDTDGLSMGILQFTKNASTDCVAIFTASAD